MATHQTTRSSKASKAEKIRQVVSAFKFLVDSVKILEDTVDWDTPLYVRNRPSEAQIQSFVRTIFPDDKLFREGVLIAPMVYAKKGIGGKVIGHTVLLRVEGVGSSPEKAMLSTRFISPSKEIQSLDDVFKKQFVDEIEILSDESYERVPDRERGIFLKLDANGEFSRRSDYRDIKVDNLRRNADRQAAFLDGLASAEERKVSAELARRVNYYDSVIDAIHRRLVVAGVMEQVARAQRLHEESRQLILSAQKDLETATRWGTAIAMTQWLGIGLQAASVLRSEYIQTQAKAEMSKAFSNIDTAQAKLSSQVDQYNSRLNDLNTQIRTHADKVTPIEAFFSGLPPMNSLRMFMGFGIEGTRTDGGDVEFKYYKEMIVTP